MCYLYYLQITENGKSLGPLSCTGFPSHDRQSGARRSGLGTAARVPSVPLYLSFPSLLARGSMLPIGKTASRMEEGGKPKAASVRGSSFYLKREVLPCGFMQFSLARIWLFWLEGGWGNGVFRCQPLC